MRKIYILIVLIVVFFFGLFKYFSIDRTGKLTANGVRFKDNEYIMKNYVFTEEGKTIGKADSWNINEIPEDKEHNFLAIRSFLDNYYVMRSDYIISNSGEITVTYIDRERYTDKNLNDAVNYIKSEEIEEKFYIKTDNIYHYAKRVYVGYNGCPVGTEYIGMVGNINGKMVYIRPTKQEREENGVPKEQEYCCYVIPDEYVDDFNIFPYYIEDTAEVIKESEMNK